MSRFCPSCRSTFVSVALEIKTKHFMICGKCAHRWSEVRTADTTMPVQRQARPAPAPVLRKAAWSR